MRHTLIFIAWLSGCLLASGQAKPAQQSPAKSQPSPQAQPSAQTQASDAAMEAKLTQTATATINWDKSTTAGAKAEVQLIKKDQANGKPLILTTTHFHPEHAYGAQVFAPHATIVYNRSQLDELHEKGYPYAELFRGFGETASILPFGTQS